METSELFLFSVLDVCFSGWFRVIYFMIRHKSTLPFFLFLWFLSYWFFYVHMYTAFL